MSECVGICEIDPDSDTCIGCGRTADEIFGVAPEDPVSEPEAPGATQAKAGDNEASAESAPTPPAQ